MKRLLVLSSLLLLLTSCGDNQDIGQRYRAERDLWQANWEFRNHSIRPDAVTDDEWNTLAQRFESIADRNTEISSPGGDKGVEDAIQALAARALFTASRIYGGLGDSIRVEQIFNRVTSDFDHLDDVAAEVAIAKGRLAEGHREFSVAAGLYQSIVDRVAPDPEDTGAAGMVLNLPLRIARLLALEAPEEDRGSHFTKARNYYQQVLQDHSSEKAQAEALVHLAEIAFELGELEESTSILRDLETRLRELEDPPRDPASVRMAVYAMMSRAGTDPMETRAVLVSLIEDYPESNLIPQALMMLTNNATDRGAVDEALGYLDQIATDYDADDVLPARALLAKARLLDQADRWGEALETYRLLPVRYPISESALMVSIEIANHFARAGEADAESRALTRAEQDYRDFISRYPPGPTTLFARERLAQTLARLERFEEATTELEALGSAMMGSPQGAKLLVTATNVALTQLADTARAVTILERIVNGYPETEVSRQAADEAARLGELMSR
jgi:TolA-binding protein